MMNDFLFLIILVLFVHELTIPFYYKRVVGVIILKEKDNSIHTTLSIVALIRYLRRGSKEEFKKDCAIFLDSLEKDVLYTTYTHGLILKEVKKRCKEVSCEKSKMKRMIFVNLLIGNTQKLIKKRQF